MNRIRSISRLGLSLLLALQLAVPLQVAAQLSRDLQVEALEQVQELKKKSALWVLSIGVSEYEEERISLKYADNDAIQIAKIMESQQGVLYREVFTRSLVNKQATRSEILKAMRTFLGQAAPDDVVLIFMAGHGLQDGQTKTYYFVPHDANAGNLFSEGLSMPTFEEACKRIRSKVNKLVLWMDTCHAGAVSLGSRGFLSDDVAKAVVKASGQYVLSAGQAGELSLEDEEFKFDDEDRAHGAFTYSLLRGLRGAAKDSTGVVWISGLFGHVSREVPRLTGGAQNPQQQAKGSDLPLFIVQEAMQLPADQMVIAPATGIAMMPLEAGGAGLKWLWVLLGAVAAGGGAVVGLSGGGGGESPGGNGGEPGDGDGGDTPPEPISPPPEHP